MIESMVDNTFNIIGLTEVWTGNSQAKSVDIANTTSVIALHWIPVTSLRTAISVLGFHYTILQWIWVGVNLGCIEAYALLGWANDMKLLVFPTKHKANTYLEHLIWSDDCVMI